MRTTRTAVLAFALTCLGLAAHTAAGAAAQRQRRSPHETTDGTVDGAALSVTYGRPYMRGRKIMGGLVPYGEIWCPGADEVTTLTTSKALRMGALSLPAGSYAVWMLPSADEWTLILNSDTGAFHNRHNARTDIGRIALRKQPLTSPVEQLTFAIESNPSTSGGVLKMMWETTEVSAPFTVVQ